MLAALLTRRICFVPRVLVMEETAARLLVPENFVRPATVETELSPADIERFGTDPVTSFAESLTRVQQRIADAARRAGRDPESVRLLL